jgi:hypothetical protein
MHQAASQLTEAAAPAHTRTTPVVASNLAGLVAEAGGMFCIVYGFSNAASDGWHAPATWGFLTAGTVLLSCRRCCSHPPASAS